jgi:hypothetical protein
MFVLLVEQQSQIFTGAALIAAAKKLAADDAIAERSGLLAS